MKVILQKNVLGLGDLGEIKEVKEGYARNYLLPRKLAVSAHAGSMRSLKHQKRSLEHKAQKRKTAMEALVKQLKEVKELEIQARVGAENKLFGSVTTLGISKFLAEKGFQIDRRKLELRESPRSVGRYPLRINLMEGLSLNLELKVVPDALSLKKMKEQEEKEASSNKENKKTVAPKKKDKAASSESSEKAEGAEEPEQAKSAKAIKEEKAVKSKSGSTKTGTK